MTSLPDAAAARPAEPGLFAGLVDDAAVFPPGNAALADAVRLHRQHRTSGYAACVGPLLVPASSATDLVGLVGLVGPGPAETLRVGVIGRPGVAAADVAAAVSLLRGTPGVDVAGVELGWTPDWRDTRFGDLSRTLEVPRGAEQAAAIADIAADVSDSVALQAKFRTGETETWAWPDETELATFIRTAIDHDLGFKLTGGLHHVVRGTHDGQEQHGLLNVLVAVRWALNGEEVDELVPLLAERDAAVLVPQVTRMSAADAAIVRAFFTAYGCCEVTDPLGELTTLGLIEGA
ncbi:hypothetical protein SAMN04489867_1722 [Pedococcus dokdonensis]|uniref:Uncharacterized protein n=1 Tax=Pedococcus dokdonensis TaxID=443156 RepID=A0A1H0QSS3_9MICO|nr:hypothetical protein [Pedococcus dokdonensis]SDP20423.1 hypothetical protein SAMN04489867_1722 [Pedococcus dokdonensis]